MTQRTCEVDGCTKPHQARGMCGPHYGTWHRKTFGRKHEEFERTCVECGTTWRTRRPKARYCSDWCKGEAYRRRTQTRCYLPDDHPGMVLMRQMDDERRRERQAAKRSQYLWRTERQCPGCACWFTPFYTPTAVCCSTRCSRRMSRQRRRAREAGARGVFTWSEFMRIARRFDYCCAYCGDKPDRLDPDHVVPLSRGGSNAPSNLLPSCLLCNSSKNAMTLTEWAAWLAERGLPARQTSWKPGDPRYTHLTDAALLAA